MRCGGHTGWMKAAFSPSVCLPCRAAQLTELRCESPAQLLSLTSQSSSHLPSILCPLSTVHLITHLPICHRPPHCICSPTPSIPLSSLSQSLLPSVMLSRLQRPMRAQAQAAFQRAVFRPTVLASSRFLIASPARSFADNQVHPPSPPSPLRSSLLDLPLTVSSVLYAGFPTISSRYVRLQRQGG